MATYFISDLHLSSKRPHLSELFLSFLEKDAKKADALYILGDLFEVWLGDDNRDPHHIRIIEALAEFSKSGIPLYFMHGNRDFLIGEQFSLESQCTLLADPTIIELYGTRVLLTHGDLLCTLDYQYQRFRKFVRHPFIKKLFLHLPLSWRQKIANFLRRESAARETNIAPNHYLQRKWDVTTEAVYDMLRKHKAFTLIHGHTHKPGIHNFILDNQPARRMVLGDWHETGSVLVYSSENQELQPISKHSS